MDELDTLFTAIEVYLRYDARLRQAGLETLAELPDWAEQMIWEHAAEAAERTARLRAAARIPVYIRPRTTGRQSSR